MAYCEDAPCCGCCGPAVEAADALANEEAYWDRMNGAEDPFDYDEGDEDWDDEATAAYRAEDDARDYQGGEDAHIDSAMESALMGEM
jgi:hypothetical protein